MSRYTSATDPERAEMLAAIGVESIDDLFADIPAGLRLDAPLDLGPGLSEQEVYEELRALAARNVSTEDAISFLGGGMYDHYVPALVDSIISRSEERSFTAAEKQKRNIDASQFADRIRERDLEDNPRNRSRRGFN